MVVARANWRVEKRGEELGLGWGGGIGILKEEDLKRIPSFLGMVELNWSGTD